MQNTKIHSYYELGNIFFSNSSPCYLFTDNHIFLFPTAIPTDIASAQIRRADWSGGFSTEFYRFQNPWLQTIGFCYIIFRYRFFNIFRGLFLLCFLRDNLCFHEFF